MIAREELFQSLAHLGRAVDGIEENQEVVALAEDKVNSWDLFHLFP